MESRIFVGGIKREANDDTLQDHFSKYGDVEEAVIVCDRYTGVSRGFGFVTLKDPSVVPSILQDEHTILGKKVDVKLANSKSRSLNNQEQNIGLCENCHNGNGNAKGIRGKIFVGGLPHNLTEEEFKNFFARFGPITDSALIRDRQTNRPRGFGFITFGSEDSVDVVLQNRFHKLNGYDVEVKRAELKREKRNGHINRYDGRDMKFYYGEGERGICDCSCSCYARCMATPMQCVLWHLFMLPWNGVYSSGYDLPNFSGVNNGACAYASSHAYMNGWGNEGSHTLWSNSGSVGSREGDGSDTNNGEHEKKIDGQPGIPRSS